MNSEVSQFTATLNKLIDVLGNLRAAENQLEAAAECSLAALRNGNKLLICGNGGSAAEAQHLAGELLGRYRTNRDPLAALALSADTAVLTCIGNDFSFDEVFSRQVLALGRPGDILIVFSTSGNSPDILTALRAAKEKHMQSVAFLGRDGGTAAKYADFCLIVPHQETARIQEGHQFLMHAFMDVIEAGVVTPS